jgi:hypothetical protein
MGFETVLAAADLGYAGLPFNWVTMPDQFTFAALDRLLRDGEATTGRFSCRSPWAPRTRPGCRCRPRAWDAIGDGRIFNAMAPSGDPPDVVWRDRDRVRDQYRQAVDYALNVVFDYAARHAADPPLDLRGGRPSGGGVRGPRRPPGCAGSRHRARGARRRHGCLGLGPRGLSPSEAEVLLHGAMRDLILDSLFRPPIAAGATVDPLRPAYPRLGRSGSCRSCDRRSVCWR